MRLTKTVLARIWWLGKGTATVMGLAMLLALTVGLASTALAGTGIGARFDLGKINKVNAVSSLVGNVSGPTLALENDRSDRAATALSLRMENPNLAPMRTNATGTVTNLNADELDGRDSTSFADGIDGKAKDASKADFATSAGEAQNAQVAASADRLDGLDSTEIGINGYKFVRTEKFGGSPTKQVAIASCPAGTQIVGGGGHVSPGFNDPNADSAPLALRINGVDLNGFDNWSVVATEIEPYEFEWGIFAMAVCAKVGNPPAASSQ